MVVAVYFIGYLLPAPLANLMNTTIWVGANPAVLSIVTVLLPMFLVVGLGLALMPEEIKSKVGL
jgi:hypothetical protein